MRSKTTYPLAGIDFPMGLRWAWEKGWLDEFSDDHFLINRKFQKEQFMN